ncbi:Caprin-1 Cytoplasmic activation- and proliferation-associated protein 1 [Larimichthys crocea]|uniref:Caprin-1 Cytoplasmic activation-and proliferation-associated protein 1 n=1 Tax=Larimichthys crocea TaxID=215358 RepID=A0A6G0IZQ2_LARCR|nr:Caprin-1 Cytoplasmic activation- and proliferation-associated protein 1 [Larimichthys crocea]
MSTQFFLSGTLEPTFNPTEEISLKTKSIKMPSAMVGNSAVQSATPDLGNGNHCEAMKQVLGVVDKKVRNMEKKKSKLDDYQAKKDKGERLNQDQLDALSKYQEIINNLEFARDLQKSFLALGQEVQKAVKKSARREQLQREEMEQRRLKTVLELQFLLDQNYDVRLTDQYEEPSLHLWDLLEGRDKAVAGTTYKSLKDILDKVLLSGYFDRAQTHQNGTCEEEEEQEEQTVVAESTAGKQPSEPEGTATEKYTEPVKVETTEFINRQFIPETSYSSTDKDQVEEWTVEAQMVNSLQHQPPVQLATDPNVTVNHASPTPTNDPVVRKQAVQDLMAQMQGTYNFMQDSMLEFDGQALDPAIVSAQPMKPVQTVDLQQMGCPSALSESRLPQTSVVPGPPESSQGSMSLSSEQSPAPCSLSSAFPPVSKPSHTGGINVNAAPFQSVQAVFNLNAPVPPATDGQADPLKQPSQFPGGYGPGFSSQSESAVEQPDIPQETLQSVVGGFQPQDQVMPTAGGHEESSPGAGFGQSGQSFYNSRGVPRGGPRNARGMMNGYRGSSNGFRGGYEGYRPPFSNAPSSGYGQTQFNTSRDYSNNTYQRDGYQQNYKRGAGQGPRGLSRGNAQAMRS